MVEVTRGRGVDARIGDVQRLDLPDAAFDCVVAAWMLYHVADLDSALSELARVVAPHGRVVVVTNAAGHLRELFEPIGGKPWRHRFDSDAAERLLRAHFARVERRDAYGWVVFDEEAAKRYLATAVDADTVARAPISGPIRARRLPTILVADAA